MMDAKTGKILASAPTGKGTDGLVFDSANDLLFSPNGVDATVTVIKVHRTSLNVVQTLKSLPGARTIALDSTDHRIFLPTADFAPLKEGERRPKPLDGTQKLLVYGP